MVGIGTDSVPVQQGLDPSNLHIKGMLARGGFAICYRATYKGEGEVAVKVIPRKATDAHAEYCLQAFVHECLLLQGISHECAPRSCTAP